MFRSAALAGAVLLAVLGATPAAADIPAAQRSIQTASNDVANLAREVNVHVGADRNQYVEEKLADADMFFRLGFYEEASILYLDIVENYPDQTAYADALFNLAESLYKGDDPYGAREYFERLLQQSGQMRFRPYVQPALGRLIELAIRMEDFEGIERYFAELNRLPAAEVAAITPYFRGKYYFFRGTSPRPSARSSWSRRGPSTRSGPATSWASSTSSAPNWTARSRRSRASCAPLPPPTRTRRRST